MATDLTPFMTGLQGGIGTGENILQNIMKRKQAQEQMRLAGLQEQRMQQQAGRASELFPLQKQLQEMQLQKARMEVDPQAQMDYIKTMQGMGGDDPNLKNNPYLRGFIKHFTGIDPAQPLPETPEQKMAREVQTTEEKELKKADIKSGEELEKMAANLIPYLQNISTIDEILTKKPNLTGRGAKLAHSIGMTKDEDIGRFASAAQSLQAMQAHKIGQRGGYGVAKIVESAKPDIKHPGAFNQGLVKDLKSNMLTSWEQIKKDYKRRTGRDLPYSIEGLFADNQQSKQTGTTRVISPNGKLVNIPNDKLDAALKAGGRRA